MVGEDESGDQTKGTRMNESSLTCHLLAGTVTYAVWTVTYAVWTSDFVVHESSVPRVSQSSNWNQSNESNYTDPNPKSMGKRGKIFTGQNKSKSRKDRTLDHHECLGWWTSKSISNEKLICGRHAWRHLRNLIDLETRYGYRTTFELWQVDSTNNPGFSVDVLVGPSVRLSGRW